MPTTAAAAVDLDDVNGGAVDSISVTLTWPVPNVPLIGFSQMVAGLTYYGDLANGVQSQFAGYEDFTL